MKTSSMVLTLLASGVYGLSAATTVASPSKNVPLPPDTDYQVVARSAHENVWQRETYETGPNGQVVTNVHKYVELATGLNHLSKGKWVESKEQIRILPNGKAVATEGQHQASFPGDIYEGQIELVTPDGKHLQSRPVGLSYDDGNNVVMLAELTNSIGYVMGANQVIYPDAFNGLKADLRYTYTKAGFEQDVILRRQPPTPESLGLNADTAKLQVLTEFFAPPRPGIQAKKLPKQAGVELDDESLEFGAMQMGQGRAFMLGQSAKAAGAMVGKQWVEVEGRQLLVEEVPVDAIEEGLAALPLTAVNRDSSKSRYLAGKQRVLPKPRLVKNDTTATMQLAKADAPAQGLVLDYVSLLNTSKTNYTFQSDTTYYISGTVNLGGTNIFEGGTVLKYATNASVNMMSGSKIKWQTSAYWPAVLTAKDDNSVGEMLTTYITNTPSGYYANPALSLLGSDMTAPAYLRVAWAKRAIYANSSTETISNAQIINCGEGIAYGYGTVSLKNVLFANVVTNLNYVGSAGAVYAINSTFSGSAYLDVSGGVVNLTNCILANVTNTSGMASYSVWDRNGFYNSPIFGSNTFTNTFYPFVATGVGNYYLISGCAFKDAGTTNIDSGLLANLATKTTCPPIVYSNVTFSVATNFGPQAKWDVDAPDLGYHYDPLDYIFGGVIVHANLAFSAGTAVGYFEWPCGTTKFQTYTGYGLTVQGGSACINFNGKATSRCVFTRFNTVQESYDGQWTRNKGYFGIFGDTGNSLSAQFTTLCAMNHDDYGFFGGAGDYSYFQISLKNSELYGNANIFGENLELAVTNCLLYRAGYSVYSYTAGPCVSCPYAIFRNCIFYGGSLTFTHYESSSYWYSSIRNCVFDRVSSISIDTPFGTNAMYADYDYNAFTSGYGQLPTQGTNNITLSSFNWQTGWLGSFYLSTNSTLINRGDRTADQLGLYHFTTQTNQVKEANSTVDIGYHYVAVDGYGNPIDTDGDGTPDYLEDANGNGIFDAGDPGSWLIGAFNGLSATYGLQVFTPLK